MTHHTPSPAAPTVPRVIAPIASPEARDRHFLFLQSHPSRFGAEVAGRLERGGHRTSRINLSVGDWLFWFPRKATDYRGRLADWPTFLGAFLDRERVTDIVYYADCRPYHAIARRLAEPRGIRTFAYEYGYLRPDWITLEPGAMGVLSHFPADPARIRAIAAGLPRLVPKQRFTHRFAKEAFNEVVYNMAPVFVPLYPFFDRDRHYHPLIEYPSHLPRMVAEGARARAARAAFERLRSSGAPYYIVAMQLQADYQIRRNSRFRHLTEMIGEVLASFASAAPPDARIVFRPHPLDTNIERWPDFVRRRAAELGLGDRVAVIGSIPLSETLPASSGAVMINSTLGLHALRLGIPVKVLGSAIYDMPGLTFGGSIDAFWTTTDRPDAELYADLVSVMASTIQVQGDFFTRVGRDAAVPEFARRLVEDTARRLGAFEPVPPRLAAGKAAGVVTSDDVFALPVA